MRKLATIAYTSLSLLLGWLGVIVGFGLLVVGILGAVAGQIIWSIAWAAMTASRARLAGLSPGKAKPETESYLQIRVQPDSEPIESSTRTSVRLS